MLLAVASGKGGTGKTTIATNLVFLAAENGYETAYLDCDVEVPNGALFLQPEIRETSPVYVSVPKVDPARCSGCGLCAKICEYGAIISVQGKTLVFEELCHGCGGCWRVCPEGAIIETQRIVGHVDRGTARGAAFVQGTLDVGQVMSPRIIQAVKEAAPEVALTIVDAPPGTSCPVIESVRDADYVLLVTEPTPFGLNDLQLAVAMVRALQRPFGVVVNRAEGEEGETQAWCREEEIPILAEIPDDRRVAEAYSQGKLVSEACPAHAELYKALLRRLTTPAGLRRATVNGRGTP